MIPLLLVGLAVLSAADVHAHRSLTPGQIVEAAYRAANAGRYDEAGKHLDSAFNSAFFLGGDAKDWWDRKTANRTIAARRRVER